MVKLSESKRENTSILTEVEKEFLKSKKLIEEQGDYFTPLFVGEIITPEKIIFSVPKNFEETDENIDLFKKILNRYSNIKNNKGETILFNNQFSVSDDGDIKSERFYFNELKEFFLDFITYEFIYPKDEIIKHSNSPVKSGKLDVPKTMRNKLQKGIGMTYRIKNIKNNKDWNLDDIYWSTIKNLVDNFGTNSEKKEIYDMYYFLLEEGYIINFIDTSNTSNIINNIKKCNVGIIHQHIKRTLLDYYEKRSVDISFKVNVFYTKNFEYVWENLIRDGLKHNPSDFGSLIDKFKKTETVEDYFPNNKKEEMQEFIKNNSAKITREYPNGFYIEYEIRDLGPDLFSSYNNYKFIGDAKYYKNPGDNTFDKEFSAYNTIQSNKYPMVILVPGKKTIIPPRFGYRRGSDEGDKRELILFFIDLKSLFLDCINDTDYVINKVQTLIKKRTRRNQ
jgi:hypothetical protein